jgi:TrbB protein
MKNRDVIRLFEHSILIEYRATGETGSISALRLDEGVRFANSGDTIQAFFVKENEPTLIERFASDALADSAYKMLQSVVRRYVFIRRLKNSIKKTMMWGALPITALMLALSMNVAVTRGFEANAQTPQRLAMAPTAPPPLADLSATTPPASQRARALADGVSAGHYSVQRSNGKMGTLYVFSDPLCPACRKLEPLLDSLAKNYTVHLFPVSVVGGAQSHARVRDLMCNRPEQRLATWRDIIAGRARSTPGCPDGDAAIDANDKIFGAMGLEFTPTIISGSGEILPSHMRSVAAIGKWLEHQAPAR